MTEREKMLSGSLYMANDDELKGMAKESRELLDELNSTGFNDFEKRAVLIKKLFGSAGKNIVVNKPFYCDYGVNIHVGNNFYANFDCIFLDVNKITIGDNVFLAPRVSIYTATHPIDKDVRNSGLELGKEIIIGNDVWICGDVVVNPGVTIGSDVVIGSGSVVTKDIPSGVVAAGNPCKVIRRISEKDKKYWQSEMEKYYEDLYK